MHRESKKISAFSRLVNDYRIVLERHVWYSLVPFCALAVPWRVRIGWTAYSVSMSSVSGGYRVWTIQNRFPLILRGGRGAVPRVRNPYPQVDGGVIGVFSQSTRARCELG